MSTALFTFLIIHASAFSLTGLGEDCSVFDQPLVEIKRTAELSLLLRPEFSLLNEELKIRSLFWTNPFDFRLTIPIGRNFQFSAGNQERFNQDYDLYYEEDALTMHLKGIGNIEEINATMQVARGPGRAAFRAGYLFGNALEVWDYFIGDFSLVDSFNYQYHGYTFSGALQYGPASVGFEGFGKVDVTKPSSDTTFNLPMKISFKAVPKLVNFNTMLMVEASLWDDKDTYRSPLRFRVGLGKGPYSISYSYNPWYIKNVNEHGLNAHWRLPVSRAGVIDFGLKLAMRSKGEFREFCISPQFRLEVNEFFARRRK